MLNIVVISGRLVRDPELKDVNGQDVTNFTLAHNRKHKVQGEIKEEVSFFDCVAWKQTAKLICEHLGKGSPCIIAGRLLQQSYEKDGQKVSRVKIIVNTIQFTGPKKTGQKEGDDTWLSDPQPEE